MDFLANILSLAKTIYGLSIYQLVSDVGGELGEQRNLLSLNHKLLFSEQAQVPQFLKIENKQPSKTGL